MWLWALHFSLCIKGERKEENINNAGKRQKEKNKKYALRFILLAKAALMSTEHGAECMKEWNL